MNKWKWLWRAFAAVWCLTWASWTLAIYLDEDIFVFAFVELALGVPLIFGLFGLLAAKTLDSLLGKTNRPKQ
jgi:hypothetical protein